MMKFRQRNWPLAGTEINQGKGQNTRYLAGIEVNQGKGQNTWPLAGTEINQGKGQNTRYLAGTEVNQGKYIAIFLSCRIRGKLRMLEYLVSCKN
jgi:hypothetical protein